MSMSSLSLLLTDGPLVWGVDPGLVGVKAGIPKGSTLVSEGEGEKNGLAEARERPISLR